MKRLVLLCAPFGFTIFAAGCGSSSSNNGDSNNGGVTAARTMDAGTTDVGLDCPPGQSESNVEGHEGECLDECTLEYVEFQNLDSCPPTHSCRGFNCIPNDECQTRVDCDADAECADSVCNRHLSCMAIERVKANDRKCSYEWKGCEDDRSYLVDCEWNIDDQALDCRCLINDVDVGGFESPETVCSASGSNPPARLANEACDLLLPLPN